MAHTVETSKALTTGNDLIDRASRNMSGSEIRQFGALVKELDLLKRNFWIRILKGRGHSNVQIAEAFGIAESTVRNAMKQ